MKDIELPRTTGAYSDAWTPSRPSSEWPVLAEVHSTEQHQTDQGTAEPQSLPGGACRRKHFRVAGPFEGRRLGAIETPVQLFDLSRGGCFINSLHEQRIGATLVLKIDLPHEGVITVKAETLYRRDEFGFAVRFTEMSEAAAESLERAMKALEQRGPNDPSV